MRKLWDSWADLYEPEYFCHKFYQRDCRHADIIPLQPAFYPCKHMQRGALFDILPDTREGVHQGKTAAG